MELLKTLERRVEEALKRWIDVALFFEIKEKIDILPPEKKIVALSRFLSLLEALEKYQVEALSHVIEIAEILESCGMSGEPLRKIAKALFG